MLYLEDYLEVIEHLPQELQNRFTDIREMDLQVHNDIDGLDERVKQFFAHYKKLKPEQKKQEYDQLVNSYMETMKYADEKCQIANQMHDTVDRLIRRLDTELEKFKLELEADNTGITDELEQRSLEMDRDTSSSNHVNNSQHSAAGIKERRRSNAPHQNAISHHNNGYHHHHHHNHHNHHHHHHHHEHGVAHRAKSKYRSSGSKAPQINHHAHAHAHNHRLISPSSYTDARHSVSAPASVVDEASFSSELLSIISSDHQHHNGRISQHHQDMQNHKSTNLSDMGRPDHSISGKQPRKNLMASPSQQHSALSAALAAAPSNMAHLNSLSTLAMMNAAASASQQRTNLNGYPSGAFITGDNTNNNLLPMSIRHNPIAAAASQAIAATQQMQQGRRTPSLKASYAAINAGMHNISSLDFNSTSKDAMSGRNALAPVVDDQVSKNNRFNQHFRASQTPASQSMTGSVSPLYISVTKSGRASKRPRHASHIYQDESPTSISSNNSIFENSESLPSTDLSETATTLGLSSPTALEFTTNMYQKDEKRYCVCRQVSYGEMVACDNDQCEFEWFHYDCVGVTQPPKGKWFCPDCTRKLAQVQQPPHKKRGRKEKSLSLAQNADINRNLNELHHQQQPKQTIIES